MAKYAKTKYEISSLADKNPSAQLQSNNTNGGNRGESYKLNDKERSKTTDAKTFQSNYSQEQQQQILMTQNNSKSHWENTDTSNNVSRLDGGARKKSVKRNVLDDAVKTTIDPKKLQKNLEIGNLVNCQNDTFHQNSCLSIANKNPTNLPNISNNGNIIKEDELIKAKSAELEAIEIGHYKFCNTNMINTIINTNKKILKSINKAGKQFELNECVSDTINMAVEKIRKKNTTYLSQRADKIKYNIKQADIKKNLTVFDNSYCKSDFYLNTTQDEICKNSNNRLYTYSNMKHHQTSKTFSLHINTDISQQSIHNNGDEVKSFKPVQAKATNLERHTSEHKRTKMKLKN